MFPASDRSAGLAAMILVMLGLWAADASAQELVPRAYWPAPKGTNALVLGYQYTTGDVVTDATLPIRGVYSRISYAQVTYQRTLDLFDRTANLQINLPYTWGTTNGTYQGDPVRRELSAMSDMRIQLSVNLRGAPSMSPAEFQTMRANPRTIVGASIAVQPPTGAYESDRLLNTGTNRWSVKPALGVIWPVRPRWLLEFDAGVWFFGDNDDFLGATREQEPIYSAEFHVVKRIRPGFWASLDLNHYRGGQTEIDGERRADSQINSRAGATLVFPFRGSQAIRVSYSTGIETRSGGDYDSYMLSYLVAWRARPG